MATVIRIFSEHDIGAEQVESHSTWRPQSPLVNARLTVAGMRTLLRMPRTQVAHVHLSEKGSFIREGALIALAHRRGLLTAATIHGASFMPFANRYPWLASAVLRRADLITCLDEETLAFVKLNAPLARAALVPNPIFVDTSVEPADATDELVVFAGEIGLRKGADVMHRAWRLVAERRPHAQCLMVGPIADFAPPRTERLEVRPPVGPQEMEKIMRLARVIALPSRAERMPMVLTEAMSLGRPFVSTPVGGIPELSDSGGGMLVAVDDEVELADRLSELLADPILARSIGERGRRFCLQTRSIEVIDADFKELYASAGAEKLAARGRRRFYR